MKKFIQYKCSVCKRTKDIETSLTHSDIDKCTITLRCEGKLQPIAQKNIRNILSSVHKDGSTDWYPRGTSSSSVSNAEEPIVMFSLSTGDPSPIVTLATLNVDLPLIKLDVTMAKDTPQEFKEFTYHKTSAFSSVGGIDNSASGLVLKFSSTSTVEVYLNGVFIEGDQPSIATELQDTTTPNRYNTTLPNTIIFNSSQVGNATIKVIVYEAIPFETKTLEFLRNEQNGNENSAWGNVNFINYQGARWNLYTCQNFLTLPTNSTIIRISANTPSNLSMFASMFLMARKPFSFLDRLLGVAVKLSSIDLMSSETKFIKYETINGSKLLEVSDLAISSLFPPVQFPADSIFSSKDEIIRDGQKEGASDLVIKDNRFIIGPS